jgi:hypothetical protein
MRCPECNGTGKANYYVEVDRDENSVTLARRKDICRTCNGSGEKPMTNADRIRAMSDEELAKFLECFELCDHCTEHHRLGDVRFYQGEKCDEQCEQHCWEWLRQPAEEET